MFVHTGNIETYLLLKEFESEPYDDRNKIEEKNVYTLHSKM
ncbi:YqzL family protein [Virgibacillus sp. W0181]